MGLAAILPTFGSLGGAIVIAALIVWNLIKSRKGKRELTPDMRKVRRAVLR